MKKKKGLIKAYTSETSGYSDIWNMELRASLSIGRKARKILLSALDEINRRAKQKKRKGGR